MEDNKSISLGCGSLGGVLLTIAIIAIRAFQPNAEPMSQWSAWSWFLMTLPVTVNFALAVVFFVAVVVTATLGGGRNRY